MFAIRSGNFQLSLMLATALAVSVWPAAGHAYTPEGRQACTGDAFRLCSAEIPDVERVRACLHRNKAQLSPGCRRFISPGAHRPAPGRAGFSIQLEALSDFTSEQRKSLSKPNK
jgi:hypothetical protein